MKMFYFPAISVKLTIKEYTKARDKYISGTPDVITAEKNLQRCYQNLVSALNDEAIINPIERELKMLIPGELELEGDDQFLNFERAVVSDFSGRPGRQSEVIIIDGLKSFNEGARINSAEALLMIIANQHAKLVEETEKSRALQRKEKKRRKKQIIAATSYILVGASAIVGNIFVLGGGIYMPTSVGGGTGAVVKGSADLYAML